VFAVSTSTSVTLRGKASRPGVKKPIAETFQGDDIHRKTGRLSKIERIIDREHDKYRELITDSETGDVLRECNEPLTQHVRRGSAKPNPK
jgi:hypothetical protein